MRHFISIIFLLMLACNSRKKSPDPTEEQRKEWQRIEDVNRESQRKVDLGNLVVLTPNLKRYDSLAKRTGLLQGLFVFCDAWGMKYTVDVFTNNNDKKIVYFEIDSSTRNDIKGEADKRYLSDHYGEWLNRFFLDSSYMAACFHWSKGEAIDRYHGRDFYMVNLMREDLPVIERSEPVIEFLGYNSMSVRVEQKGAKLFITSLLFEGDNLRDEKNIEKFKSLSPIIITSIIDEKKRKEISNILFINRETIPNGKEDTVYNFPTKGWVK